MAGYGPLRVTTVTVCHELCRSVMNCFYVIVPGPFSPVQIL
jgi:hypothetical protein